MMAQQLLDEKPQLVRFSLTCGLARQWRNGLSSILCWILQIILLNPFGSKVLDATRRDKICSIERLIAVEQKEILALIHHCDQVKW